MVLTGKERMGLGSVNTTGQFSEPKRVTISFSRDLQVLGSHVCQREREMSAAGRLFFVEQGRKER